MTGAYLRVKREKGWENIELEHLTKDERTKLFIARGAEELLRWMDILCEKVVECEAIMDGLVKDGVLERKGDTDEPTGN